MQENDFQLIAELPEGYEYKIFQVNGDIRIMGAHRNKEPIAFKLEERKRLVQIELQPRW